ncbi:hypothetical protein ACQJBY_006592 [Aegilops geniculata]
MRAPQDRERTMRDLYDRTRHKDLALLEESNKEQRGGGAGRAEDSEQRGLAPKIEDNPTVRKRPVPSDGPHVKAESGTCNVCSAPCSSCLHRDLAPVDSNMDCGSSQTCCARSESRTNLLVRSGKGLRTKGGENDDELSATSSHASYSENGGHKAMARSIAADSEVNMPAKRRRLLSDTRSPREECHDDSNSCVTGTSAASKLLLDKKKDKLSTSASSRDLTVKDYKDKNIAGPNRLRNSLVEESTEKKRSDVHIAPPSSSDRSAPADSPTFMTKKLLRTQSSVSAPQGLSPKKSSQGLGNSQDNLAQQPSEKVPNNDIDHLPGGKLSRPVIGGDKHDMVTSCSTSSKNKIKAGSSSTELETGTRCTRNGSQEHTDILSDDFAKRNDNVQQDQNQGLPTDEASDKELNTQNDAMIECGNSESLIDVNVCDICGDVGREYLLATCTRCLEGAEHTYCMRVKLDKVPDGEWLCEECQLNEDRIKTRGNRGASTVDISNGKNQDSESMSNPKTLQTASTNLGAQQIASGTPVTDHLSGNNVKLHSGSTDTEARQVKCASPNAGRLDAKSKNFGSMANRKRLQIVTSDTETRPPTCGTPLTGRLGKKYESSEDLLNRKKLRIATDMELPMSSEGLLSPPKSSKRHAENASSSNPRPFKTECPRKHDIFSHQNSFKKSNKGNLKPPNNAPVKGVQAVKSSMTLSRSYSLGSLANAKAPVPSPRGPLSKQLSFNNSKSEPKVKQLAEGVASKLKPVKHSPIDVREKGPMRKLMKSESFKREGSVSKDSSSLKQNKSSLLSRDEKPRMLKLMSDKSFLERRPSFILQKPPLSPRPDSSVKSGDRKVDQDNPRPGPSILKTSKKPGNIEKKQISASFNSEKRGIAIHQTSTGVVSSKDADTVKTSDPLLPVENVNKDNDCVGEASLILRTNDNKMSTHPEVLSTPLAMTCETDLQSMVPRASASEDLTPNVGQCQPLAMTSESQSMVPRASSSEELTPNVGQYQPLAMTSESDLPSMVPRESASEDLTPNVGQCQQEVLENTEHKSIKSAEEVQAAEDILPESPHDPLMAQKLCAPENKLSEPNLKHQDSFDQLPTLGNLSRTLVIPEQTYIWQGIFEVSRTGISSELYDGIQAHLSTCTSAKALEVVKQLPQRIRLIEVPRGSLWPHQFKEVQPSEDNIALFFFAQDVESYERYGKLLEKLLVEDLCLTTNINGVELLILSSDNLPEKIQRWNGFLYFWGVFYARKANSSTELVVKNPCPLVSTTEPFDKPVCSPKVPQSLGIDLNQCPDDELYDSPVSLGSETEKSGASEDHKTLMGSTNGNENLDACEIHHQETAVTREIVLGSGTAVVCETYIPMGSGGHNMKLEYPSDTTGGSGTEGRDSMKDEESFSLNEAPCYVERHVGASRSMPDNILAKKKALTSLTEVSLQHQSESILKADFVLHDSESSYKRQKIVNGDEQLPSERLSKIHSLPAGWRTPFDDSRYAYKGLSDIGSTTKAISDQVVHVLSSDDEGSPEHTTMNKAPLKAEQGSSSPLLSLSLSTAAKTRKLASSDAGDDRSLSLSLGLPLPGVAKGNQALEIKQFLPEKPGINTSFHL